MFNTFYNLVKIIYNLFIYKLYINIYLFYIYKFKIKKKKSLIFFLIIMFNYFK